MEQYLCRGTQCCDNQLEPNVMPPKVLFCKIRQLVRLRIAIEKEVIPNTPPPPTMIIRVDLSITQLFECFDVEIDMICLVKLRMIFISYRVEFNWNASVSTLIPHFANNKISQPFPLVYPC